MDEVIEEMSRIQKLIEQDGKLQVLKRSKDDSSDRDIFPSWSWAGWVGDITYYPKGVRDREYKLVEAIKSAIVWPWEKCASRAEEHAAIQRVLDTEVLDIEAEVAVVDLCHVDTSPVEWPGWPLDNGKWSRWGRFECILLSRQLRDPIYDEPILKHKYLAPKYRIGPLKVKELDDSGEEVESKKCLVNLMVVELSDGGVMKRKGLVMLREDIWAFFGPVRKTIRLG